MLGKKGYVFFYLLMSNYAVLGWSAFSVDIVTAKTSMIEVTDEAIERRYVSLLQELRCPKCQNQNLRDSNSIVSLDLKNQIHRLLKKGKSDEEIKSYLTQRYTEYILYRPVVDYHTLLLWVGPLFFVLIAISVLLFVQRLNGRSHMSNKYVSPDQPHSDQVGLCLDVDTFKKE